MRIRRFSTDRVRSHRSRRRSPSPPPLLSGNREHLGDFPSFPSDFQPVPRPSRGHLLPRIFLPSALVPSFRNTSLRAFALRYLSPAPPRRSGLMCSSRAGTSGVAARLGVLHPLRLRVNSPLFAGLSPSLPGLSTRSSVLLAPDERFSQTRSAHSLGRFYASLSFPFPPSRLLRS